MVDQLEKDLLVYERRKRTENQDDPLNAEITAIAGRVARICEDGLTP